MTEQAQPPERDQGKHQEGGKVAPTPQDGVKVRYPLAPRGPLSGREQEGELFQGDCSEFTSFSFPSASNLPSPLLFTALPVTATSVQASGRPWQRRFSGGLETSALMKGTGKRHKPERGV